MNHVNHYDRLLVSGAEAIRPDILPQEYDQIFGMVRQHPDIQGLTLKSNGNLYSPAEFRGSGSELAHAIKVFQSVYDTRTRLQIFYWTLHGDNASTIFMESDFFALER